MESSSRKDRAAEPWSAMCSEGLSWERIGTVILLGQERTR